jgi:DNA-binding PadR family transcriptional regulator
VKLTRLDLLILVCLAQQGIHGNSGYGILKDIKKMTKGHVSYSFPSLYSRLAKLNAAALIESSTETKLHSTGHNIKVFSITALGDREIRNQAETEFLITHALWGLFPKPTLD